MSYIQDLLYGIAAEMKKDTKMMDPIIQKLADDWIDNKEALLALTTEDWKNMKVPLGLVKKIQSKLADKPVQKKQQMEEEQIQINKPKKQQKPKFQQQIENPYTDLERQQVEKMLVNLKQETMEKQKQMNNNTLITNKTHVKALKVLKAVVSNIVKDVDNVKFRTIKLSNKKFVENCLQYPAATNILQFLGFQKGKEVMELPEQLINFQKLWGASTQLNLAFTEAKKFVSFNPYAQHSTSTSNNYSTEKFHNQIQDKNGYESVIDQINKIKEEREKLMVPVKNRRLTIFMPSGNYNQTIRQLDQIDKQKDKQMEIKFEMDNKQMDFQENNVNQNQELDEKQDEKQNLKIFRKMMVKMMREQQQSSNFSSKRQKELQALIKKPFFIETKVRIRFPDQHFIQCIFSPKETILDILNYMQTDILNPEIIQNSGFYLYQTPPVVKLSKKFYNKQLQNLSFVPSVTLFLALDKPQVQNALLGKMFKKNLYQYINKV